MLSKTNKKKDEKISSKKTERHRPGSISITFQISAEQLVSKVLGNILVDVVYTFLLLGAVFYNALMSVRGDCKITAAHLGFLGGDSFKEYLKSAVIEIMSSAGKIVSVPVGNYIFFLFVSLAGIFTTQFIMLIAACVIIPGRTYERLSPLFDMTEAAKALKNIDIAGKTYSPLENALSEVSGNEDIEIHTGKEELAGLEDAINDLLKRTRASYQSQIRFVSDASHELRTPIAVIQGYANMLDRWGREDEEILNESIVSIKSEAENMSRLVENLLFLARGDSGRAIVRFEEINVKSLVCDIYDEFVMIDANHEFQLDVRSEIKAVADISLLKQCLRILVDNAVKYSPEKTDIIIRLQMRDDEHYCIEVQDNGIGIKQDEADKIFERFYRSDPARNRQNGGYGLGLSIAKWIADQHSGFFEVLSYENLGTRISLVLPIKPALYIALQNNENSEQKD